MPTIYRRRERIKELNGRVGNGVAVVAHTPTDVLALEGLVDSVADLPGDPLANLYRVLANAGRSPETWPLTAPADLDNEGFPKHLESLDRRDPRIASLRVASDAKLNRNSRKTRNCLSCDSKPPIRHDTTPHNDRALLRVGNSIKYRPKKHKGGGGEVSWYFEALLRFCVRRGDNRGH